MTHSIHSTKLMQAEPPGAISHLELKAGGPGTVHAKWRKAYGAERYRVFKQVIGTDIAPVQVAREVRCNEFTFIALPPGAQVLVTIMAVNAGGYGSTSFPVQIEVPG